MAPASAEKRVALVIGNSAYKNVVHLPNPARDAAAVADMLKGAGFDVVSSKLDLTNTAMRRVIREFTGVARNADIAVVYYAGHGIEFDGINYMVPVDALLASDVDVEDETLSLDRIMRMLEPVKRLKLVILDACRDNPFNKKMARTIAMRSLGRGLGKIEVTASDTLVAYAAKAGSTAADGDGEHSPFTTALLHNLTAPGVDVRIAFGRVRDEVLKNTNNRQEPFVYGSLGGSNVSLVPPKAAPAPVAKPIAPPASTKDELVRDYEFAQRIDTLQGWNYFLAAHSAGLYADLARAARDKIIAAEQRQKFGDETRKNAAAEAARLNELAAAEVKARATAKRLAEEETQLKARIEAAARARPAPVVVATAPSAPAAEPSRTASPAIDAGDVARLLQFHLKRVGCDPGTLDGNWTDRSTHAMQEFNERAKTKFDVKVASIAALDAVRGHKARVCPLVCGKGFKVEEDRCVATACERGFVRNRAGNCERETKSAAAPKTEKSDDGAQVFCGPTGCQPIRKNCHVIPGSSNVLGGGGDPTLVCN